MAIAATILPLLATVSSNMTDVSGHNSAQNRMRSSITSDHIGGLVLLNVHGIPMRGQMLNPGTMDQPIFAHMQAQHSAEETAFATVMPNADMASDYGFMATIWSPHPPIIPEKLAVKAAAIAVPLKLEVHNAAGIVSAPSDPVNIVSDTVEMIAGAYGSITPSLFQTIPVVPALLSPEFTARLSAVPDMGMASPLETQIIAMASGHRSDAVNLGILTPDYVRPVTYLSAGGNMEAADNSAAVQTTTDTTEIPPAQAAPLPLMPAMLQGSSSQHISRIVFDAPNVISAAPADPIHLPVAIAMAAQAVETAPETASETPPPSPTISEPEIDADNALIEGRKRPGFERPLPEKVTQENPGAVRPPPPEAFPTEEFPVPDRWRLIQSLGLVKERWFDPYHQNTLKGDRPINLEKKPKWLPIKGHDWFFVLNAVSDTIVEPRSFPIPGGDQTTTNPGQLDVFGRSHSLVLAQTYIVGAALIKGSTAFKPPDVEYRLTLAYQVNHVDVPEHRVLHVQPSKPTHRTDSFLGVQEAFIDYHLKNTSDRYDFRSIRVGIQPFNLDFRGFLFQDNQLGVRLFGNRDNNRFQFNAGAIWRLEKDTNSGLNDITQKPRKDWILFANLFRQDFPIPGFTSQISVTHNINREAKRIEIDQNGFPVRPALLGDLRGRDYDVTYLGYAGDGRLGRINLTTSLYAALGEDRNSIFTSRPAKIRSYFAAAEASYDVDWARFRLSGLYASGDSNYDDNKEGGFDAIFENPIFAGADTSYWIRQTIPFAGGGRVISVQGRNGLLNSLRSSKEQGQSNFNNPGTMLLGAGADFDITPEVRFSTNVNHLWFENTNSLQHLRNEGSIPKDIGWDISGAVIWRPKATQNIVFRLSAAMLEPGKGFRDLFNNGPGDNRHYSVLFNAILAF